MQYYKVEFTISKDGTVTEKVIASGANCTAVTQGLEKAIGEIRSQELLPEALNDPLTETLTEQSTLWTNS
ncbi:MULTISPECIES: DUF2997 domain-containing protein [unclassified Microcoleus]|uniref:DUF2997 domain-containing protein n=1 Tax=unclassified Microcoleus TaxID=2642155 RepID=UPI002FD5BCE6